MGIRSKCPYHFDSYFLFRFLTNLHVQVAERKKKKNEGQDRAAPRPRRGLVATRQEREPAACAQPGLAAPGIAGKSRLSFTGFSNHVFAAKGTWWMCSLSLSQYELFRFPRHFLDTQKAIFKYREGEATRGITQGLPKALCR